MKPKLIHGITGIIAVIAWLFIFLPGLIINSQEYRDNISNGSMAFSDIGMTFLTYTITNVAILCCLAGIIGACSNLFLIKRTTRENPDQNGESPNTSNPIFVGVLRGFLVYILFIAGVYAAASAPFSAPTAEQYTRMAGTVSLLSFVISFEPSFFKSIIGLASKKIRTTGE